MRTFCCYCCLLFIYFFQKVSLKAAILQIGSVLVGNLLSSIGRSTAVFADNRNDPSFCWVLVGSCLVRGEIIVICRIIATAFVSFRHNYTRMQDKWTNGLLWILARHYNCSIRHANYLMTGARERDSLDTNPLMHGLCSLLLLLLCFFFGRPPFQYENLYTVIVCDV